MRIYAESDFVFFLLRHPRDLSGVALAKPEGGDPICFLFFVIPERALSSSSFPRKRESSAARPRGKRTTTIAITLHSPPQHLRPLPYKGNITSFQPLRWLTEISLFNVIHPLTFRLTCIILALHP